MGKFNKLKKQLEERPSNIVLDDPIDDSAHSPMLESMNRITTALKAGPEAVGQALDFLPGATRTGIAKLAGADLSSIKPDPEQVGFPTAYQLTNAVSEANPSLQDSPVKQTAVATGLTLADPMLLYGMGKGAAHLGKGALSKLAALDLAKSAAVPEGFGGARAVAEQESSLLNRFKGLLSKEEPLPSLPASIESKPSPKPLEGLGFEGKEVAEALNPKMTRQQLANKQRTDMLRAIAQEHGGKLNAEQFEKANQDVGRQLNAFFNPDGSINPYPTRQGLDSISKREYRLAKMGKEVGKLEDQAPTWFMNDRTRIPMPGRTPEQAELDYIKTLREAVNPKQPELVLKGGGPELRMAEDTKPGNILQFNKLFAK